MDTIRAVVRNLVFLVLLAGFLEMLLPLKETRRFLQVVLGLFVLVAVLNPVVTFFRQTPILNFGLPDNLETGAVRLDTILKQGKELQRINLEEARTAYVNRLEEQVAVVARLVPGIQEASARVILAGDPLQQAEGTIDKIYVTVQPERQREGSSRITPVEKIGVGVGSGGEEGQVSPSGFEEIAAQVHDTVVSLFGLHSEQVVVKIGFVR